MFGNGQVTDEMMHIIRRHVAGKSVWDLGAGIDCMYSHMLLELGAEHLTIIEKEEFTPPATWRVTAHRALFQDVDPPTEGFDVAWVSWPVNRPLPGLVDIIGAARTVIYLGSNVNGSACGTPDLFSHLLQRELVDNFTCHYNSLLVYSSDPRTVPLVEEEYAATQLKLLSSEEAREEAALAQITDAGEITNRILRCQHPGSF